jgi:hypothetical protein
VSVAAAHSYEQRGLARDAFREKPLPSGAKVDPKPQAWLALLPDGHADGVVHAREQDGVHAIRPFAAHREDLGHAPEPAAECNIW